MWEKNFISYVLFLALFLPLRVCYCLESDSKWLAITHYRFYYMNSIYYNEQRIINKILKYKDDFRRKDGEFVFKYLEFKNR